MLGNVLFFRSLRTLSKISRLPSTTETEITHKNKVLDTRVIPNEDTIHYKAEETSVLEACSEDISDVGPFLKPTFNLAAYVNKSETLQQFLKLGVQLHKWERSPDIPPFVLQLDFEKDIKKYIIFFSELGLETDGLKNLFEKNPLILKEDLENLQVRINYLKYKKFSNEMVVRIVQANPKWLSFSTQDIDSRLGHFQKTFSLTGNEVRELATQLPKVITYDLKHIKLNTFVLKEEMGFTPEETKGIILKTPKLLIKNQNQLLKTFTFIHKEMKIPLETIAKMPDVLTCREFRIKQRYHFIEKLGKVQFNPKQPNYISLLSLVSETDSHFATEIAGSSIHAFNAFLKTL